MHTQVQHTLSCILNNFKTNAKQSPPNSADLPQSSEVTNSSSVNLVLQLFNQCNLIDTIINTVQNNNVANSSSDSGNPTPKKHRPGKFIYICHFVFIYMYTFHCLGYMGHLIKIANAIQEKCDEEFLQKSLSPELFQRWTAFVKETLSEINKQMRTPLVNEIPSVTSMNEDVRRNQENALQQVRITQYEF